MKKMQKNPGELMDWNDPDAWEPYGVPGPADEVVIRGEPPNGR